MKITPPSKSNMISFQNITSYIQSWDELSHFNWDTLLLGNGFSISVWEGFNYRSLYNVADSNKFLNENSINIFKFNKSFNFEDILKSIYHAVVIDTQMARRNINEIALIYKNIQQALTKAIEYSHVAHEYVPLRDINLILREYRNIYTTNYDLIPYWSIIDFPHNFVDYFWNDGLIFDKSNTNVRGCASSIGYLHGAIHLEELSDGGARKISSTSSNLSYLDYSNCNDFERIPLIVTEGTSRQKRSKIFRNEYLGFIFDKFSKSKGKMVIFGQSLHENCDGHIIEAIKESDIQYIAISVWPGQDPLEIIDFKRRMAKYLNQKYVSFFDSTTHPLGKVGINRPNACLAST